MSSTVLEGLGFVEAPRWRDGRLYFSDFYARTVSSVDASGELRRHAYVAGQPSGLGFTPDGELLVVSVHEGLVLAVGDGATRVHADLGSIYRGNLNDMHVAPSGQAYVSAFPRHQVGEALGALGTHPSIPLFRVEPDGTVTVAADDLAIPNGILVTADGQTLIVAETNACRLTAFDVADDGTLDNRRVFADLGHRRPDGICLDATGGVWFGSPFTSEFVLVREGGDVVTTIETPGRWAVSCALADGVLWCTTVDVTIDDYRQGRGRGAIEKYDVSASSTHTGPSPTVSSSDEQGG